MNQKNTGVIVLGSTRIRVSNIKNYGISSADYPYEKIYKVVEAKRGNILSKLIFPKYDFEFTGKLFPVDEDRVSQIEAGCWARKQDGYENGSRTSEVYRCYKDIDGTIKNYDHSWSGYAYAQKDDIVMKEIRYLYITTYQNDNYRFREDLYNFNIHDKCKELDNLFNQ